MAQKVEVFSVKIDGIDRSIKNLSQLKEAVGDLEERFQSAEFGSQEFRQLQQQLLRANSELDEMNAKVAGLKLEDKVAAGIQAVNGLGGAFAAAAGGAALFTDDTRRVEEVLVKLSAALSIVAGLQALADGFKAAAVAARALGISLRGIAGPLALIATAVTAVVGAFLLFRKTGKEIAKETIEINAAFLELNQTLIDTQTAALNVSAKAFEAITETRRRALQKQIEDIDNYLVVYKGLTFEEVKTLRSGEALKIEALEESATFRAALLNEDAKTQIATLAGLTAELAALDRAQYDKRLEEQAAFLASRARLLQADSDKSKELSANLLAIEQQAFQAALAAANAIDENIGAAVLDDVNTGLLSTADAIQQLANVAQLSAGEAAKSNDTLAAKLLDLQSISKEFAIASRDAVNAYTAELIGLNAALNATVSSSRAAFEDRAAAIEAASQAAAQQAQLTIKDAQKLALTLKQLDADRNNQLAALANERLALQLTINETLIEGERLRLQTALDQEADYNRRTFDQELGLVSRLNQLTADSLKIRQDELDRQLDANLISFEDYTSQVQALANEQVQAQIDGQNLLNDTVRRNTAEQLALLQQQTDATQQLLDVEAQRLAIVGNRAVAQQQRQLDLQTRRNEQEFILIGYGQRLKDQNSTITGLYQRQLDLIEQQEAAELATLQRQADTLLAEKQLLEDQATKVLLTEEELARLRDIGNQLKVNAAQQGNVILQATFDKEQLAQELEDVSKEAKKQMQALAFQQVADLTAGIVQLGTVALDAFSQITQQLAAAADAADQAQLDRIQQRKELIQSEVDNLSESIASLEEQIGEQRTSRQSAFIQQLQQQQASLVAERKNLQELDKEEERVNARRAAREKSLAKQQLAIDTAKAYAQLALAIATAAANAAASGPAAIGLVPATIATVLAAAAPAIASTIALASFEKGGVIEGPRHAQGGVVAAIGGRPVAEIEGGEGILTRGVMKHPVLASVASHINQLAGGAPLAPRIFAEDGGIMPYGGNPAAPGLQAQELAAMINGIQPVLVLDSLNQAQNRDREITVRATL